MMDIRNKNYNNASSNLQMCKNSTGAANNITFKGANAQITKELTKAEKEAFDAAKKGFGDVGKFTKKIKDVEYDEKDAPILYKALAGIMNPIGNFAEKHFVGTNVKDAAGRKKLTKITDIITFGNATKELTCMIFYPLMTLTNQDIPTEKKRFVGIYDFFVTCFSLTGTLLFAKAKPQTDKLVDLAIDKYTKGKYEGRNFKNLGKARDGAAFVFTIALQTLLCKRVIAPALSPKLAAGVRRDLERRDAEKATKEGKPVQPQVSSDKIALKPQDMPAAKAVEKPAAAKAIEKPSVKTADKPAAKTIEKPAEKAEQKPAAKPVEKPAEKTTDKVADKKQPEQNLFAVYNKQTKKTEKTA